MKYTYDIIEKAVSVNNSVSGVLRFLGLKQGGGTHVHLTKLIKDYKIDCSHFTGKRSNCGIAHKGANPRLSKTEVLIDRTLNSNRRQPSFRLRRALIESGVDYTCNVCGIKDLWCSKEIRLQVNHKNSNWLDDRLENLEFLCPNCHSQTDGFCGSLGKTSLTKPPSYKNYNRKSRKKELKKIVKSKGNWPNKEELQKMVNDIPITKIAKIIGVSDVAVNKKCVKLGIKTHPSGYWSKFR